MRRTILPFAAAITVIAAVVALNTTTQPKPVKEVAVEFRIEPGCAAAVNEAWAAYDIAADSTTIAADIRHALSAGDVNRAKELSDALANAADAIHDNALPVLYRACGEEG